MSEKVLEQIRKLKFGDLIIVDWWDHSKREIRVGKGRGKRKMILDVPATSFGVFLGIGGEQMKHIIVGRDIFRWLERPDFDVDLTSIMIPAIKEIKVAKRAAVSLSYLHDLERSFKEGSIRIVTRGTRVKIKGGISWNEEDNS